MDATRRDPIGLIAPMLFLFVAACAAGDPSSAQPSPASVQSLIGDASCEADSQCQTIAVGAKACGGPSAYLAWSSRRTDGDALRGAAERETQGARARLEKSGVMSNCAVVTDPGAYCAVRPSSRTASASVGEVQPATTRQCQLRQAGSGGAARIY